MQDEQVWLVGTLNEGKPPAGSSSDSLARRLNRTAVGARAVQERAAMQLDKVRSENRRVKQLEEVAKAALAEKLRDTEKRSLEEMTETHAAVRDLTPRPANRNKT
jgi:DNA-directed RNA polymerase specialized sigma54-like protein